MRYNYLNTVDRHGLSALAMTRCGGMVVCGSMTIDRLCHCEEGTQVTDAAIHRISRKANGFVSSLTGSQWIATGLRPRDDKSEGESCGKIKNEIFYFFRVRF